MNTAPRVFLVCYDITAPGRLRAVYKTMRGYGDHLQYSVFRCLLSPTQLARMRFDLLQIIEAQSDQILIVPLGRPGREEERWETLGLPLVHQERVVKVF